MVDTSVFSYFTSAGGVVKTVMMLLFLASIVSWVFIFQRYQYLKKAKQAMRLFEEAFWSGADLHQLYKQVNTSDEAELTGLSHIFHAGFKEYLRLKQKPGISDGALLDGIERAMRIANAREQDKLENHLSFLATVGSTSPYIGLFGTVWGIMAAFHALGNVSQATISMVAPGISEALVATAMGLFAAIPAVIAYNRFSHQSERIANDYDTFQEEFSGILHRQASN